MLYVVHGLADEGERGKEDEAGESWAEAEVPLFGCGFVPGNGLAAFAAVDAHRFDWDDDAFEIGTEWDCLLVIVFFEHYYNKFKLIMMLNLILTFCAIFALALAIPDSYDKFTLYDGSVDYFELNGKINKFNLNRWHWNFEPSSY